MGTIARKTAGRLTADPIGIDPLATIAFVSARQQLSERLRAVSTVQPPSAARRRRGRRAALARWIRTLPELLKRRERHGQHTPETPSSRATA
jgi:hypothetical protein